MSDSDAGSDEKRREPLSIVALVALGIAVGLICTGLAGVFRGSQGLNALTWLGTTATVAALIVAIGIYQLQRQAQSADNALLHGRLDAQDELIAELANTYPPASAAEIEAQNPLTETQRKAVEDKYGDGSIASAWLQGHGKGNRARLVRLKDGKLVTVYSGGRAGGTYVREVTTHPIGDK